jgi:hypothetical protein
VTTPTSFRLSEAATELLESLSSQFGLKRSGVVELALRELAEKHGSTRNPQLDHAGLREISMNYQTFEIRTPTGSVVCTVAGTLRTAVTAVCQRLSHTHAVLSAYPNGHTKHPLVTGYFDRESKRRIDRYLLSTSGVEFKNWEDAEENSHGLLPGDQWKIRAQFRPFCGPGEIVGHATLQAEPSALPAVDAARESGIQRTHYGRHVIDVMPIKLLGNQYWTANFVVLNGMGEASAPNAIHAMYEDQQRAIEAALSNAISAIDGGSFAEPTQAQ